MVKTILATSRMYPKAKVHLLFRKPGTEGAELLALIGTILMTAVLALTFVFTFLNFMRDLVPALTLLQSFIYAFGCLSVAVFFYVFHGAQA